MKTAVDLAVTMLAAVVSATALWWLAHGDVHRADTVIGALGVSSIVLAWAWAGLILLADRVLRLDWRAPGLLNLTCLVLGALTCSCFGATIALVMAGFGGPPSLSTTLGFVTYEGGSGWAALDRFGAAALTLIGWSAAFLLGVLSILAWFAVAVTAWRLPFRASARAEP